VKHFELAVCLDDLKRDVKDAMALARRMGFGAVDIAATSGAVSPFEMTESGKRHLRRHLGDLGLRLASLRGPASGPGYADATGGDRRLETARRVLDLAAGLGVPVVTTALGTVGDGAAGERARLGEALRILADAADRRGVILAVETGGVSSADLRTLLGDIDCPHLAACCDSGAMLMHGEDPAQVGALLAGRVRAVRARDAVPGRPGSPGHEVAHGEGQLSVERFLGGLAEAGYGGDLTLTRTAGANPVEEIARAKAAFERVLRG